MIKDSCNVDRFGLGTIILHFSIIFPLEKDLNSIWELCDGSGNVVKTQEDLQVLAKEHFSDQFKDQGQCKIDAQLKVISHLPFFFLRRKVRLLVLLFP